MVFHPSLHLVDVVLIIEVILAVIHSVKQRIRRRYLQREGEFRTFARIDGVVDRATGQGEVQAQVVAVAVGHHEVLPVSQHVALVRQLCRELEVVVRPIQTLTEHQGNAIHLYGLVGVVIVLIIQVVAIVIHAVAIHAAVVAVIEVAVQGIVVVLAADVRLAGIEGRDGEGVRTLAAKPRVVERNAVRLIVAGVGLSADGQRLSVALRQDAAIVLTRMQEVGQGEVGELQAQLTDDACLSPTGREFHLVVGLGHQLVINIHRSVFGARLDVRVDLFGVKVSHLGNFAIRTHQVGAAEQLSGACTQFAAHYILVQAVVTANHHLVNRGLPSFGNTHFQVNGVAHDIHFHRVEAIE